MSTDPAPSPGGSQTGVPVFAVMRLRVPDPLPAELGGQVAELVAALAARPGCRGAELGHAVDDPELWALVTRWDGVGAYRRGLSAAEVKMAGAPVWPHVVDEPGAYLTD